MRLTLPMSPVVLIIFLTFSQILFASSGPGNGGGGSTIQFKGQSHPFLLDRLTLNPDLARRTDVISDNANPLPTLKNKDHKLNTLEREDIKNVLGFADNKLKTWMEEFKKKPLTDSTAASLGLISLIRQTLEKMTFLRTPLRFKLLDRYDLDSSLKQQNPDIQMAVLYLPQYGAIISELPWNDLDIETQAGLLIHESIRQIQGAFSYHDLTDRALQSITAKIMDGNPSANESFVSFVSVSPRFLSRCILTGYQQPEILNTNLNAVDLALASLAANFSSQIDLMIIDNQNQKTSQTSENTTAVFLQELKAAGILTDSL